VLLAFVGYAIEQVDPCGKRADDGRYQSRDYKALLTGT
jgi:hypothetical protein